MKIFKYALPSYGPGRYELPVGSQLLSVGLDLENHRCFWALVNPLEKKTTSVLLEVVFTGQAPTECHKFIGTITSDLVYHVFSQ